ncbi:MAG TPA: hypothetical protein VF329_06070 [Gammaproteobacteria bacterium]
MIRRVRRRALPVLQESALAVQTAMPLSTMVVTASRRAEDVQDVAMAVSAFDGAALREVGVTDAMQLQAVVPSLTYVATGHGAQPYLRGIGTRQSPIGMEASVATFIDNRYVTRPFAAMFDTFEHGADRSFCYGAQHRLEPRAPVDLVRRSEPELARRALLLSRGRQHRSRFGLAYLSYLRGFKSGEPRA